MPAAAPRPGCANPPSARQIATWPAGGAAAASCATCPAGTIITRVPVNGSGATVAVPASCPSSQTSRACGNTGPFSGASG